MDEVNQSGYYSKEDLRNILRLYLTQYSMWMRFLIISMASSLKDQEVIINRIYEIPLDLSKVFSIYFTEEQTKALENLFREHIRLTIELIKDTLEDDHISFSHTMVAWTNNTKVLSRQLSSMNPFWNQQQIESLLTNLLSMTLDETTKRKNMRYADDVYEYDNIEYFVLMMADLLWDGMIKNFYSAHN